MAVESGAAAAAAPVAKEAAAPVAAAAAAEGVPPPKVDLPDRDAFERKVQALKDFMKANKAEKDAIQKRIEGNKSPATSGAAKEFHDAREHQKAIQQELNAQKEMVSKLIARQNALRERRGKVVAALREGRSSLSVEEIDRRIADIDYRMSTEGHTLSLKEEKDLVKSRTDLNKQRRSAESSARDREATESSKASVEAELDALNEEITAGKAKQREIFERLKGYNEVVTKAKAARDAGRSSTDSLRDSMRALSDKNNKAYAELKALQDAHFTQLRQARAWRDYDRKRRQEEWEARKAEEAKARKEDDERRAKEEEEAKPDHPWALELVELDMLLHYIRKAAPQVAAKLDAEKAGAAAAPEAAAAAPAVSAAAASLKVGTKAQTALDALGDFGDASREQSSRRGRGRGRKGGRKASGDLEELSFDLATLGMFGKFGIEPPLKAAEAEEAIKRVQAKHAEYESKPAKTKTPKATVAATEASEEEE
ncbi:hypothetical protein FNF27_02033 [Cafeteria roenbergensis]|nr:hypothetical protein FNF29_01862 [Cafeteria roenbergensis]KAA0158523.1 hypothetical protein FNF31_05379 [Cafeteria roenbergensis]KAA0163943.1 hypothetical protein FNF28_04049 [Cafeteria roenbergensis]KAA0176336.1 hypothetical protein FNF27_02033 [Cafeteria roenbergensis]|eukprot:KAA0155489.1 hypothetical protein FNF29_01862 [Cafeteria roenbergensis]